MSAPSRLAVIIPAHDAAGTIAATVAAARAIPGTDVVVVVDDGSGDDTVRSALAAGALVLQHARQHAGRQAHRHGRAAALRAGAERVALLDAERPAADGIPRALLFIDAGLGATAAATRPLTEPVLSGAADLSIAVLPQDPAPGGHGLVVDLARRGIVALTGWNPAQPLSGTRCLTRAAYQAASPLAGGCGLETAMTIDLLTAGFRVLEVPCELERRASGTGWRSRLHRARQLRDVALTLAARRLRRAAPLRVLARLPRRRP